MSSMKIAGIVISLILVIWAGASLAYIWGDDIISFKTYFKLSVTLGIIAVVVGVVALIFAEYFKEKKYKDEKFLD